MKKIVSSCQNLKNYVIKLTLNLNFINQNDIAEKKMKKKTFEKKIEFEKKSNDIFTINSTKIDKNFKKKKLHIFDS